MRLECVEGCIPSLFQDHRRLVCSKVLLRALQLNWPSNVVVDTNIILHGPEGHFNLVLCNLTLCYSGSLCP